MNKTNNPAIVISKYTLWSILFLFPLAVFTFFRTPNNLYQNIQDRIDPNAMYRSGSPGMGSPGMGSPGMGSPGMGSPGTSPRKPSR